LRDRTATGTSNPYFASRSKIRNLDAESKENSSRSYRQCYPSRIFSNHLEDHFPNFLRRRASSHLPPGPGDQPPVTSGNQPGATGLQSGVWLRSAIVSILTRTDRRQPRRACRAGVFRASDADVSARRVVGEARESRGRGSDVPARGEPAYRGTGRRIET